MPFIQFQTNKTLTNEEGEAAVLELSALIAKALEKPEGYVQVMVEGGKAMAFGGSSDLNAFIELSSLGLDRAKTAECARQLCHFAEEWFSIPSDRVYIKMADHPRAFWGWHGGTFE